MVIMVSCNASVFLLSCVEFLVFHISMNISGPSLVHFKGAVPEMHIEDGGSMYFFSTNNINLYGMRNNKHG
jgi:hypothetical protein